MQVTAKNAAVQDQGVVSESDAPRQDVAHPTTREDAFQTERVGTPPAETPTDPRRGLAATMRGGTGLRSPRKYVINQDTRAVQIAREDRASLPFVRPDQSLTEAVDGSRITDYETQTNKARLYFRLTSFCEPSEGYIACGESPVLTKQQWYDVNEEPVDVRMSGFDAHERSEWGFGLVLCNIALPLPVKHTMHTTEYSFSNENLTEVLEQLGVDVSQVEVTGYENLERENAIEVSTRSHGSFTLEFKEQSSFNIRVESHENIPEGLEYRLKGSQNHPTTGERVNIVDRVWDGFRWDYVRHPSPTGGRGEPVRLTREEVEEFRSVSAQDMHEEIDRYGNSK